jgi:molecular chaperone HscC
VVSLDRSGEILVGAAARERVGIYPQACAAAFKRTIGTSRAIPLRERTFRPEELSSFVLRSLKADAEAFLGAPVHEAIITVLAYFSATRSARRRKLPASSLTCASTAC